MTEVINEVKVSDEPLPQPETPEAPEPTTKAKAKPRVSKAKAKEEPQVEDARSGRATAPVVDVKPALDEVQAVVELPMEEAKTDVKSACPDCGKQMSAKTLKYSHSCPAAKKQKPVTPRGESPERKSFNPTQELIEWEVQRRLDGRRRERAARREEMVNKLMQSAF
jgi:hypothetical protein